MRHLWLVKLDGLDQSCAPDLPSHVDINDLSYTQLRGIIVRAVKMYYLMMKGSSPTAAYELRKTIVPAHPDGLRDNQCWFIDNVKIAPGGRYLFMYWNEWGLVLFPTADPERRYKEFRILDLGNGDRCIWSYSLATGHETESEVYFSDYDFEICRDGSISVLLATVGRRMNGNIRSLLKLFKLTLSSARDGAVQEALIDTVDPHGGCFPLTLCVDGDFVVCVWTRPEGLHWSALIVIVNWRRNQMVKVKYNASRLRQFRIWHGHLFYVDFTIPNVLCTFSLMSALSLASPHSAEIGIGELEISHIPVIMHKDGRAVRWHNIRYSIYDRPWRGDSQIATVSIIMMSIHDWFGACRVTFDPRKSGSAKWMMVETTQSGRQSLDSLDARSRMSRSGRVLIGKLSGNCARWDTFFATLDRRGLLHFPRFSSRLSSLHCSPDNSSKVAEILERYMEQYSGALVVLNRRRSGKDWIELYYPDVQSWVSADGEENGVLH